MDPCKRKSYEKFIVWLLHLNLANSEYLIKSSLGWQGFGENLGRIPRKKPKQSNMVPKIQGKKQFPLKGIIK